ncbi:MAG: Panacea domain-containing protein [Candidatus Binataceae bacterium]
MRFPFHKKKAAQGAAFLLARHSGRMSYMLLIKLLYFADRQSLIEIGQPITGDQMVSMPHGPVLSEIYDLINWWKPEEQPIWFEYVSEKDGYDVCLAKPDPERDELSDYELDVLAGVDEEFGHLSRWEVRDISHTLPEWKNPQGSSRSIDPAEILRAAGKSEEQIGRAAAEAEELCLFETLQADRP